MTLLGQGFGTGSAVDFVIPGGAVGAGLSLYVTVAGEPTLVSLKQDSGVDDLIATSVTFPVAPAAGAIINFYSIPDTNPFGGFIWGEVELDFTDVPDEDHQILPAAVPGAEVGDMVLLALPDLGTEAVGFTAWVASAGVVEVKAFNYLTADASHVDLTELVFGILVVKRNKFLTLSTA
jgi:hypothetical protein